MKTSQLLTTNKCERALAALASDDALQQRLLRFLNKRAALSESGCHEFRGVVTRKGYGVVCFLGAHVHAQRVAWVIANKRPIPSGLMVMHQCNNRACVNPAHLEVGTNAENMRYAKLSGSYKPYEKLSRQSVLEAALRRRNGESLRKISLSLGVNRSHLSRVFQGKAWGECLPDIRAILSGHEAQAA